MIRDAGVEGRLTGSTGGNMRFCFVCLTGLESIHTCPACNVSRDRDRWPTSALPNESIESWSLLARSSAEKSPSLIPIDAEVEPCRTFMPGAKAHNGRRSDCGVIVAVAVAGAGVGIGSGAFGSRVGVEMMVRDAIGSRGYTRSRGDERDSTCIWGNDCSLWRRFSGPPEEAELDMAGGI